MKLQIGKLLNGELSKTKIVRTESEKDKWMKCFSLKFNNFSLKNDLHFLKSNELMVNWIL